MLSLMGLVLHYYHGAGAAAAAWPLTAQLAESPSPQPGEGDSVTHSKFAWRGCLGAVSTKENKGLKIAVTMTIHQQGQRLPDIDNCSVHNARHRITSRWSSHFSSFVFI